MVKPTGRRLNTGPAKVCSKVCKSIKHHLYFMQNTPALDNFDCKGYKSKLPRCNQIKS